MKLQHFIPKSKEKTYYSIPFEVPENVERITVGYDYKRPVRGALADFFPTNTIDIGLMDNEGNFLGWSGSAHKEIFVGEFASSDGYLQRKTVAGTWQILVGAYRIMDEGVEVTYNIEFTFRENRLLFGDLHIHTTASDGSLDAYSAGKLALKKGLDFVALANHNNFAENLHLPSLKNLTFIPAVEWTHYRGHMNFFGVAAPFENSFIANTKDEMRALIRHAKSKGAVISVNHPKCPFCPYLWDDDSAFDMMEIWNGPMTERNVKAIIWWTELLKTGRRIPICGGSDYHTPYGVTRLGKPVTGVYTPSRGAADIMNAISSGHAFVAGGVNGARPKLRYGEAMMGDTVSFDENKKLLIEISGLRSEDVILVTDNGERVIARKAAGDLSAEAAVDNIKFAYLMLKKRGFITAVTNPVYFQ